MESAYPRNGRALRETAKLAGPATKKPVPKPNADSSGLVDLAALMAAQPNWLDDALSRARSSNNSNHGNKGAAALPAASFAPVSLGQSSLGPTIVETGYDGTARVGAGWSAQDALAGAPRRRSLPLVLATLTAGLLVAAACVFAFRPEKVVAIFPALAALAPAPPPAAHVAAAAVLAPPQAPAIPAPPAAADGVPAPAQSATASAAAGTAAGELATVPAVEAETTSAGHRKHHGRHEVARALAVSAARPAPAPAAEAPRAPAKAAPPPAAPAGLPPPPAGSLGSALRAAAAGAMPTPAPDLAPVVTSKPAPAAPAAPVEGRPERPSGSAVTTALTEALNAARKCLPEGSTEPSRALVNFGPDGAVHKVDVSGPASSDPKAVQCMRTAFTTRSHVPPFSQATYAAGVTIRPH